MGVGEVLERRQRFWLSGDGFGVGFGFGRGWDGMGWDGGS